MDYIGAIIGPVIGLIIVAMAYLMGVCLSIKCCQAGYFNYSATDRLATFGGGGGIMDPEISIISRHNTDYFVGIPHSIVRQPNSSTSSTEGSIKVAPGPAPEYEEPPSYEDCIQNGMAAQPSGIQIV